VVEASTWTDVVAVLLHHGHLHAATPSARGLRLWAGRIDFLPWALQITTSDRILLASTLIALITCAVVAYDSRMGKTMNDAKTEHSICAMMREIAVTAQELLNQKNLFPALILLYSGIDILGSLLRPKASLDTLDADFKKWVDLYLIKGSSISVTSDDLWGARCGLLQTNTPGSKHSRMTA
jgi:hypothetical protein